MESPEAHQCCLKIRLVSHYLRPHGQHLEALGWIVGEMGGEERVRGAEEEVDKEAMGDRERGRERGRETNICIFIYKYREIEMEAKCS